MLVMVYIMIIWFYSNCTVKGLKHEAEFYGITPLGKFVACLHACMCVYVHYS